MNEKEKDFVAGVFFQTFKWLDCRDIQCLYEKMKDGIYTDIIECADKDFNSDDIRCAIRRVLFNEFEIQD